MNPTEIKDFRKHHKLTQQQCADMVYISVRNWKRAEHGEIPFKKIWTAMLILRTDENADFVEYLEQRLDHLVIRWRDIK